MHSTVRQLRAAGIGRNDSVAVVLPNGPEMAVAFLAVASAGACAPLNPAYRVEEFDLCMSHLDARALVVLRGMETAARRIAQQRGIRVVELFPRENGSSGEFMLDLPSSANGKPQFAEADDIALLLHTSGTTAGPKIVPLTHRNLTASAEQIRASLGLTSADCCLNLMPLFHIHGLVGGLLASMASGGSIVCTNGFDAPRFFEWLDEFRPTWYTAVPTVHQSVLARAQGNEESISRSRLRFIRSSSAALPARVMTDLERMFRVPVIESYGMTEAAHQIASNPLPPGQRKPSSVGLPAGPEIAVMDAEGKRLPSGEVGEIAIRGPNVTLGYRSNPDANRSAFHDGWFRTGDQGYLDSDGYLFLTGRLKEIVNRGGEKISPREVDEVLLSHPAVTQAITFALPDIRLGEDVGAAVVLRPGCCAGELELQEYAAERLADFKVPRRIVILDQIPTGPTGKPQRVGLADRLGMGRAASPAETDGTPFDAPMTTTEAMLCSLWKEVLGIDRVGTRDDFFHLGGDSLLATQLIARVREKVGVELKLVHLFSDPTVAAVAGRIEQMREHLEHSPEVLIGPRSSRAEAMPSFAQERMHFLQQCEQEKSLLNRPALFRVRGPLSVDALRKSFTRIVERHEVLRTTYHLADTGLMTRIEPPSTPEIPILDFAGLPGSERAIRAMEAARREARRPFDLSRDLMLRVTVMRLDEEEYYLFLNMHHSASDGWSSGVLFRELSALYSAHCERRSPSLPELPIQYADFAVWQRQALRGEIVEEQISYWRKTLEGSTEPVELPADHPRPVTRTYRGQKESIVLPQELAQSLKAFSNRNGVTLFMTALAAFQTLLYRYTGVEDLVVGSVVANRTRRETENLIGPFMNTVALRADLSGNPTFGELLARVRSVALDAFAHQNLPFDKVVEALNPLRSVNHRPFFQVMFQLRNLPLDDATLHNLTVEELPLDAGVAQFDLYFEVQEVREGLRCQATYSSELFDEQTIRRVLGHYRTILKAAMEDPNKKVARLPNLTEQERRTILEDWNQTERSWPSASFPEMFEAQVERTPNAPAVLLNGKELSYRELNERANRVAHHLRRLRVGPEALVGVCIERSFEMLVGLLGILKAGGAYVPLDPDYPRARLALMLADADPLVVLTSKKVRDRLPPFSTPELRLDSDWPLFDDESPKNPAHLIGPSNAAYVIYTSGSTGRPKGVITTHEALANFLWSVNSMFTMGETDRVPQVASYCFDFSVCEMFSPLSSGGCVVLLKPGGQRNPTYLAELMAQTGVTVLNVVPSLLSALLEEPRFRDCLSLRIVNVGGEALGVELHHRFFRNCTADLYNGYGPTEATVETTFWKCHTDYAHSRIPIGRPIANSKVYVLDKNLQPVPVGVPGELYLAGIGLARGYLNAPEKTLEKFIPDPFSDKSGARLYKTGDRVRFLPDGNLDFLGRLDQQVKIRGFRIELGEVEWALAQHPDVGEAAAAAHESSTGERSLVAYFVSVTDTPPTHSELTSFLRQQLPDYMVPAHFVALESLPRTPNGKLDRKVLPGPEAAVFTGSAELAAPLTRVEAIVAGIWCEVLGRSRIQPEDDFFMIGGDSLKAVRLVAAVNRTLGSHVSLEEFFQKPTIAGLVAVSMRQPETGSPTRIPRRGSSDPCSLSFAQKRFWFLSRLEPDSPKYNVNAAIRWRGPMNVAALEESLQTVVMRHELLRTTYHDIHGRPVQVAAEQAAVKLGLRDQRGTPAGLRDDEVRRFLRREAARPFDLSRDVPLRAALLRLDEEEFVLFLSVHHIACDGWSFDVLYRELAESYACLSAGGTPELKELPIQYADFALWQLQSLQGQKLEEELRYWLNQLSGPLPVLSLLADSARLKTEDYRAATETSVLPVTLLEGLRGISEQAGVTIFMVIVAAFQTLLQRLCAQDTILIGTPMAGREQPECDPLIGPFMNTVVLRTDLSADPSFLELLGRVRRVVLGAFAHRQVPFDKLVEALNPARATGQNPLFDVMLEFNNSSSLEIDGVQIQPLLVESPQARFAITLHCHERADGLHLRLVCQQALFSSERMQELLQQFQALIEGVVDNPAAPISKQPLLTDAERREILDGWKPRPVEYPRDRCIHELFELQAVRSPQAVAVRFEEGCLTYDELNRRANRLAHHLRSLGVQPEVLVGICLDRCMEMMVAVLGVLKAGGAYVPIDPHSPPARLSTMIDDAELSIILTRELTIGKLPEGDYRTICLDRDWAVIENSSDKNPQQGAGSQSLAYVIYTSGSTGKPKGVLVEHRSLVNYVSGIRDRLGLTQAQSFALVQPLSVDASVTAIYFPLMTGGCVHLISEERSLDARSLSEYFRIHSIDCLKIAPSHLAALNSTLPRPLMPRRKLILGGEPSRRDWVLGMQAAAPDCEIVNHYGPTEATVGVTVYTVTESTKALESATLPIGRPLPNVSAYVLDQHMELVPVGVVGELYVGGDCLARGYLNQRQSTEQAFVADPFRHHEGARLYRTGDLARSLPDGNLEFLGRRDGQVKIRGFRVELGEIEAAIAKHPVVREVAVLLREATSPAGGHLVAYVTTIRRQDLTIDELRSFLQKALPDFMWPQALVRMDALPRTRHGKLDRRALLDVEQEADTLNCAESETRSGLLSPRTAVEKKLAEIWSALLGLDAVSVHDNFFELGGHSLLVTQLVSRVRDELQAELDVRCLFDFPTIEGLAGIIEQSGGREAPAPLVSPVSFAQRRLWFLDQFEPGGAYNISAAYQITGRLDVSALEASFNEVVRRHEALRTTFSYADGEPAQVIHPSVRVTVAARDLREVHANEREFQMRRAVTQEARRPFDLSQGPLHRVTVFRLGEEEHLLLITFHHIVFDGWSWRILRHELRECYAAFSQGTSPALPPPALQYRTYAQDQIDKMQGPVLEEKLRYWRKQLAGAPSILRLPEDYPRPRRVNFDGAAEAAQLGADLCDQLKALAGRERATLFMVLLSAFQLLLHRYTGQEEIVVGAPITERSQREYESLIGLCVNSVVLRTDLSGHLTFRELLRRVRQVALEAYEHQDAPFDKLVEDIGGERDPARNPLFDVMINFAPQSPTSAELTGLSVKPFELTDPPSKLSMTLYLSPAEDGLGLRLVYQRAVFAPERMSCFLRHFRYLLEQVAAEPDQPIDAYSLVTVDDRRVLPDPTAPMAEPLQGLVTERFAEESRRSPASVAVCQGARSWTYSATYTQAVEIALGLRTRGLQSGDVVAVCGSQSFGLIASMMGVLFSGGVLLPVATDLPVGRKQLMVRETRAKYLLWVGGELPHHDRSLLQEDIDLLFVDPWEPRASDQTLPESVRQLPELAPENPAYIFFTSGTTGVPKAVLGSHKALSHFLAWQRDVFRVGPQDRVAQLTNLSFDPVLRDVFLPLTSAATVCLPEDGPLPPENVLGWLEKERITILHTVPTLARAWLDGQMGKTELDALRCVFFAGEPLPDDLVGRWRGVAGAGCQIVNLYGPTETTMTKSYYIVPADVLPGVQPVGGPLPDTQLLVLSDRGRQCGVGELGQIAIRTPFRTFGYLNRPDENEKRFVRNPFREDERDLVYVTGDRGRHRLDGSLEVLGRVDDQVKVRGVRIEPAEVAAVLARYPGVESVFVGSWEPEPGQTELAAYIVPDRSGSVGVAALTSFLTENLPAAMFPSDFVFLDQMPRTANGKVDRRALPKPVRSGRAGSVSRVPPSSLIERQVAAIWSAVLGIEEFGVDENFFALGGNSLRAAQVVARVRKTIGSSVSVRTVFEAPTIAGFAAAIEKGREGKEEIGELLLEIEAMSDEEASSLLGD